MYLLNVQCIPYTHNYIYIYNIWSVCVCVCDADSMECPTTSVECILLLLYSHRRRHRVSHNTRYVGGGGCCIYTIIVSQRKGAAVYEKKYKDNDTIGCRSRKRAVLSKYNRSCVQNAEKLMYMYIVYIVIPTYDIRYYGE